MNQLLRASVLLLMVSAACCEILLCGEVKCPKDTTTCSLKYHIQPKPRIKVTTVHCYDSKRNVIYKEIYESPVTEPEVPLPAVECGGLVCKEGTYNCTTITTPMINQDPPIEKTHLTCRNQDGGVIEERDVVRTLSLPETNGAKPPTCEKHTCPPGSRSCSYETVIHLEPYKKSTHVICYDINRKITSEVTI